MNTQSSSSFYISILVIALHTLMSSLLWKDKSFACMRKITMCIPEYFWIWSMSAILSKLLRYSLLHWPKVVNSILMQMKDKIEIQ